MALHTMKPKAGHVYRGRMHSGRWRSQCLCRVRPSIAYRHNLLSLLKTTERHSILQSTLSRRQSSRAWRSRGVSGSLARGTRDEFWCKQKVPNSSWWHNRCNMCPDFFPGCCSGGHRCSNIVYILTCVCTTRPSRTWSTGVGMFHWPLPKAAS